jgi:hypothetical protein
MLEAFKVSQIVDPTGSVHGVHRGDAASETSPSTLLTDTRIQEIIAQVTEDKLYLSTTPESPFMRLGFHIAASYDSVSGEGGWNALPTRANLRQEGLLDDIMVAYWDVLETYYDSTQSVQDMTKADFISFLIYMYTKGGIFTPNVTWRAGRGPAPQDGGAHMGAGRPNMPSGFATSFKPESNMTDPEYLRHFFSRLNIFTDKEIVLLMSAHALGSARGIPYLGEFPGTGTEVTVLFSDKPHTCGVGVCYMYYTLYSNWTVGCPTTCKTCLWTLDPSFPSMKSFYNEKDPYNTTFNAAPANYTDPTKWGDVCKESLGKLDLFEYTDETKAIMRLPVEVSMLADEDFVSAMKFYTDHSDQDKVYAKDFAEVYGQLLELGVPADQLYDVVQIVGNTPPFEGEN